MCYVFEAWLILAVTTHCKGQACDRPVRMRAYLASALLDKADELPLGSCTENIPFMLVAVCARTLGKGGI